MPVCCTGQIAFEHHFTDPGNGLWLSKSQSQCLILWRKLPEWAAALHEWALSIGMQDAVTSVEEIIDGEDSHGSGAFHVFSTLSHLQV